MKDLRHSRFCAVPQRIRIEMLDLALQDLSGDVVVATAFFHIHLPMPAPIFSRETARLVLTIRQEDLDWKITHSSISIPYHQAQPREESGLRNSRENPGESGPTLPVDSGR